MRSSFSAFLLAVALFAAVPLSGARASAPSSENAPRRTAIVLASFGSTVKEAREVEAAFVRETEKRYPGARVVLANTARIVMKKNAKAGIHVPSLFRALADLADEGFTHVAVQGMQIIPGEEFEGLAAVARAQENLPKGIASISVGAPLLASNEDCEKAAKALIAALPKERKQSEPVIFVGHGTSHGTGGMVYPALQWHMARQAPKIYISTIEGTPAQDDTLAILGDAGKGKPVVWVAPLLALAGDHAVNDLFGDADDSWKGALTRRGWQVREAFVPLYTIPAIRDIWFAHLDAALAELGVSGK